MALLLLLLLLAIVHSSPVSNTADESETYRAHIASLLDALNSDAERQYNYNFGRLVDAQRKSDALTSLTIEVDAECFAYAGCPNAVLLCSGSLEHFVVLPGMECKHKHGDDTIAPAKTAFCPGCAVELNVDVPGVEALIDTAIQHLESERSDKHLVARVLRLQREIVAGVKFVLLLEIQRAQADDELTQVCRIEFMQKPWISNDKHIVANNCTATQHFPAVSVAKTGRSEVDNEIDVHNEYKMSADMQDSLPEGPNYDKMAETGNLDESPSLSPSMIASIEAQVVPTRSHAIAATQDDVDSAQMVVEDVPALQSTASSNANDDDDSLESGEVRQKRAAPEDDSDDSSSASKERKQLQTDGGVRRKRVAKESQGDDDKDRYRKHKKVKSCGGTNDNNDDDDDDDDDYECPKKKKKPSTCDDSDDDDDNVSGNQTGKCAKGKSKQKKYRKTHSSSSSSSSSDSHQRRKRDTDLVDIVERSFAHQIAAFVADRISTNSSSKYEVLEVVRVKKTELEGTVYHMVIRFATHKGDKLGDEQLCKVHVHASKDRRSLKLLKMRCHEIERRLRRGIPGAAVAVSKDDPTINSLMKQTLVKLDAESTHANKLKLGEIIEATKQVVAGMLYKIKVSLFESDCAKTSEKDVEVCGAKENGVQKTCTIRIWDRPWLANGRETNSTCEDAPNKVEKRSLDAVPDDHLTLFWDFVSKYNKTYNEQEATYRYRIFKDNMRKAAEFQKYEQGTATYGASRFADLSPAEFRQYLGYRPELRNENQPAFPSADIPDIQPPTDFDWRTKNAVTKVKDQGQCGSCWAFSVTGNVEGQYAIRHGKLLEFSEQELVDCDKNDEGCNGGLMDTAYRTIEQLGGLEEEKDYPYDAEDETCKLRKNKIVVQLTGALNISQDETDMAKWLVQNGPISIAINADAMQFYLGGVSHPPKFLCNPKDLDHGVLIVGYGVHQYKLFNKILPYWIVKNSWGPSWGEQGYYRVYRGGGTCGLNQEPTSAIVA